MSLGVGAMQINGGLNYLFGVPNNKLIQGIIILIVTVLFLVLGVASGIQYLSNLNMLLAAMLFIIILIVGPTILIMNMFTSSIGEYLNTLIFNSFDVAPLNSQNMNGYSHGRFIIGLISRTLRPIFGNKVEGPLGTVVDVLAVLLLLLGLQCHLGLAPCKLTVV